MGETTALAQAPPNDNCTNPTAISGNGSFAFDNTLATTGAEGQSSQNCNSPVGPAITHDVWYCWTATCTGLVTIDTCGLTSVDTKIAFYTGGCACPTAAVLPLCCNDDWGQAGCTVQARIGSCEVTCCQQYLIQLGTKPGTPGGTGSFAISCQPNAGTMCPQPCPGGGTHEPVIDPCCGRRPAFVDLPAPAGPGFYPNGAVIVGTYDPFPPGDQYVISVFDMADYTNNLPYTAPLNGAGACGATTITPQGGGDWGGYRNSCSNPNPIYHHPMWTFSILGSVYGTCLDDVGNIYACHSSAYPLGADGRGSLGGAGSVYQIDTLTGQPYEFIRLPNQKDPNTALGAPDDRYPGLGNICYDCAHRQFFVSDLEDGRIYRIRIDPAGNGHTGMILSNFDHATGTIVNGAAASLPEVEPAGWVPLGERLWGVEVHGGRLYYAVWNQDAGNFPAAGANAIRSIALTPSGNFTGASVHEVYLPLNSSLYSQPVASIAFGPTGHMLLGERGMTTPTDPTPHDARALELTGSSQSWVYEPLTKFTIGTVTPSSAGGVAYDYAANGRVWVTGDALHLGNPDNIYGIQGLPSAGGNYTTSILLDLDHNVFTFGMNTQDKEYCGDVAVSCPPSCVFPPIGMVAWWPLDETSGGISQDIVAAHNGNWLGGPTPVPGKVLGGMAFNGSTSRVDVPDDPNLDFGASIVAQPGSGDLSIDCWIRNGIGNGIQPIVDKRDGVIGSTSNPVRGYTLFLFNGNLSFQLSDGLGTQTSNYISSAFVADNL